jgi:hypothetical protein
MRCIVGRIGGGALGEDDPGHGHRSLALGRRGERGGGDLVGRKAGRGRSPDHLGDDPGEGLGPAPLGRPIGHPRAAAMAARDIAGVGQPAIDGPDGVRVDTECGPKLAHRRQARAGEQAAGVDLVRQLPEDLGRDRDVGITSHIQVASGGRIVKRRGDLGFSG